MKHLLNIESLDAAQIDGILARTAEMKRLRGPHPDAPLAGECWALMFSKSSTRTRISFEVGIRELGGQPVFLAANDIQLGRGEPISDTARVMGRMVQGAVIRTYAQGDVEQFAALSGIRTINALTDLEHPCQILSDLFTIIEKRGSLDGLTVTFIGDGDCNVARSWIWAAAKLGFALRIAAPAPAVAVGVVAHVPSPASSWDAEWEAHPTPTPQARRGAQPLGATPSPAAPLRQDTPTMRRPGTVA